MLFSLPYYETSFSNLSELRYFCYFSLNRFIPKNSFVTLYGLSWNIDWIIFIWNMTVITRFLDFNWKALLFLKFNLLLLFIKFFSDWHCVHYKLTVFFIVRQFIFIKIFRKPIRSRILKLSLFSCILGLSLSF